ncbi:hypothetical protein D3C85_1701280 [compost metagenome]
MAQVERQGMVQHPHAIQGHIVFQHGTDGGYQVYAGCPPAHDFMPHQADRAGQEHRQRPRRDAGKQAT